MNSSMLVFLELFTAVVSLKLFHTEVVRYRFHNYATSIFLLCFVPLFCVYPVIARLAVGGAYSVQPGDNLVIDDTLVYVIYQLFCLGILLTVALSVRPQAKAVDEWSEKFSSSPLEQFAMIGIVTLGVVLYVRSTGFSVSELIVASRFEWFNNATYSSALYVVSSYLMALAPVALLMALCDRRYWWILLLLVGELVLFGLMSKDRKWAIYLVSAAFAFTYFKNHFSITLRPRFVAMGMASVLILAFWQVGRGVIFTYLVSGSGDILYDSRDMAINLMTRGDLPYYYNASITAINMNVNYDFSIPFGLMSRQLLFFLPSDYSFGLKVEDISALFSDALGAEDNVRRGNMPPGLFGLFALSFGWLGGIILCSLLPFLLRVLDRFIQRSSGVGSMVVAAHMLSATMLLLRGDDSSATYFIVASLVLFFIIRPAALMQRAPPPSALQGSSHG